MMAQTFVVPISRPTMSSSVATASALLHPIDDLPAAEVEFLNIVQDTLSRQELLRHQAVLEQSLVQRAASAHRHP